MCVHACIFMSSMRVNDCTLILSFSLLPCNLSVHARSLIITVNQTAGREAIIAVHEIEVEELISSTWENRFFFCDLGHN